MKPMVLKKSSECCGSPTLIWIPKKAHFTCPCGKLHVDAEGRRKIQKIQPPRKDR